jgi:hypothetical protein
MNTLSEMWKLKVTLVYILLWMVYSDAAFLIGNIGTYTYTYGYIRYTCGNGVTSIF